MNLHNPSSSIDVGGHQTPTDNDDDTKNDKEKEEPRRDDAGAAAALIVGAGDALGSALAHKFAKEGFTACVVRRDANKLDQLKIEIEKQEVHNTTKNNNNNNNRDRRRCVVETFPADARKEGQIQQVVEQIESTLGLTIEVAIHNIGANIGRIGLLDERMTSQKYYKVWEMASLSAFLMGQAVVAKMVQRKRGTIIFTGATASIRGSSHHCAFASAMFAKRALAQSMAREFGPHGVHVAHVIIDGGIETEFVKQIIGEGTFQRAIENDALLKPTAIAENYWNLYQQPKVAWTHELDLRPWVEKW